MNTPTASMDPPGFMSDAPAVVARAGAPLPAGTTVAAKEDVIVALKTVYDPEIPVNVYELGLIYRLDIGAAGDVAIDMTLTAPACPVAGEIPHEVAAAVAACAGVGAVEVRLVWEPAWTPEKMSRDARLALDLF